MNILGPPQLRDVDTGQEQHCGGNWACYSGLLRKAAIVNGQKERKTSLTYLTSLPWAVILGRLLRWIFCVIGNVRTSSWASHDGGFIFSERVVEIVQLSSSAMVGSF